MSQENDPRKTRAKELFDQGEDVTAIARELSVNRKTIQRWANDGAWREKRDVIPIGQAKSKQAATAGHQNPPSVRRRRDQPIDERAIVDDAIISLSDMLTGMNNRGEDVPVDTRGVGGVAGALVRLFEYRRKINPPTAADLAEMAIALGVSPTEFVAELKAKWQQRA
ncbi:MAG TPA: hypothetical protein V6C88_11405 [Chroococcidiopsis sp.]